MSNLNFNPMDMGDESTTSTIPSFTEGRFITVRIVPPKGKSIREGLVATLAMISYKAEDGQDVPLTVVNQLSDGTYNVEFPRGKRGIMATKYRGPKSWYRFKNNKTEKFYVIGKNDPVTKLNSNLTIEFAEKYLAKNTPDWNNFKEGSTEREDMLDSYFEDMYMYGFAKDYNLEVEEDLKNVPFVGLVTNFYRKYTPPTEGERYGNVIVTKFAPKEGKAVLNGDYTTVDAEIAASIYTALTTSEASKTSFDPNEFVENSADDVI